MKTMSPFVGKPFFAAAGAVLRSARWQRRVLWVLGVWLLLWVLA
ncbi:MAG: hypothetical protein ABIR56_05880 [Polaromonas sp.]